jgi:hypothetical protein
LVVDLLSFTQNLMQTKRNTKSKKHSCENNVRSQHGVTWQTDTVGFRKCDLGLSSSFTEVITTITVRELYDTTSYWYVFLILWSHHHF